MKRILIYWFSVTAIVGSIKAQHQDPSWSVRRAIINQQCIQADSLCNVLHKMGTFEGHLRTFFMGTVNHEDYPDYYALAMGGGLAYFSPVIKNFQVGMSGFIIYNMASSHLGPQPPYTNRYELGLFDINNPDNHDDLDRLEDLYLRYYISQENHSYFQVGKFHLKTPLINLQDGRMRPNLQQGIWGEWNEFKKIKLSGGWLWRTSPRSTIRWFDIGESLGVYPGGRATNGLKSAYAGNVKSDGIAIANVTLLPVKGLEVQAWNYRVTNVFNTSLLKAEYKTRKNNKQWFVGMQYLTQHSLYSDTVALEKQYTPADEKAHALSARVGTTQVTRGDSWDLNYTRITAHGRFLFPREWGVEPFYTFMFRERVEGAGDVHAIMLQNQRPLGKGKNLSLQTQGGVYWMPSVSNAVLNKYTMPGFYHINVRARYKFKGFMHGLQGDIMYSYKGNLDRNVEVSPATYHNKVDAHLLSVVLDYYF
ncbi:MAG: outer membrane porin, OprD family [Flammeovirgaceae bacterium]|nr:MAG: outer membrane porin, OprD family [Flammeovirgaceae bacterium]